MLGFSPATAAMSGPQPSNPFVAAFLRGMSVLWVYAYGEHFVTEPRGAEGRDRALPGLRRLSSSPLRVDVIVAVAASLPALKEATSTIPIVMAGLTPTRSGWGSCRVSADRGVTSRGSASSRSDGQAAGAAQGGRAGGGGGGGPLGSAKPSRVGGGRPRGPIPRLEAAVAGDSRRRQHEEAFKTAKTARAGSLLAAAGPVVPHFRRVTDSPPGTGSPSCTSSASSSRPAG